MSDPILTEFTVYQPTVWHNDMPPSIDEVNLYHMENQIYQNSLRVADLIKLTTAQSGELDDVNQDIDELRSLLDIVNGQIEELKAEDQNLDNKKADKSNTYTKGEVDAQMAERQSELEKLRDSYIPNNYYKKGETWSQAEADGRYLRKDTNDSTTHTVNFGTVNTTFLQVNSEMKTTYESIRFDADNSQGVRGGGYSLYVQRNNPGGAYGDVWIKNA